MIEPFDRVPNRRSSDSLKWNAYPADVLPMWVADMDFPSPPGVIEALRCRVEHGIYGYPIGLGSDSQDLAGLLADRLARLYGWQVAPEAILFLPGVITGFHLACHALAVPYGGVLVQPPVYPPILQAAAHTGAQPQQIPLVRGADGAYAIDFDAFEAAITPDTRLFILCNPHNPVGRVFRRDELLCLAETCLRRGVWICSDEIHGDLVYPGHPHLPIASLDPEIARRTITLMAPTKTFNLAGLQCAYAIIPDPQLRAQFEAARQGLVSWVNLMGLTAAAAAYREGQEWLDRLLVYLQGNRDYLAERLPEILPGVRVSPVEGTYLAWLDCREAGLPEEPYEFFLKRARIAFNDGKTFGPGGEGFVRLNFGCPRPLLDEALRRMQAALAQSREGASA